MKIDSEHMIVSKEDVYGRNDNIYSY